MTPSVESAEWRVGGAGAASGLLWQHLQCTSAIVYLPLRGLANGAILIGPSLTLPSGGRIDSYPGLKREDGESWLAGCGERQGEEAGRGVAPPLGIPATKQRTNGQPFQGKSVPGRGKWKIVKRFGKAWVLLTRTQPQMQSAEEGC